MWSTGTHLRQSMLVFGHLVVRQLDRDALDLFLLLLVVLLGGLSSVPTGLAIASEPCLENVLDEVIGAEDIASLGILDHPIREPSDMARCFKHGCRGHDGRIEFEHVILDDKVTTPFGDDVGLERGPGWTIVVQTCDACVDDVSHGASEMGAI